MIKGRRYGIRMRRRLRSRYYDKIVIHKSDISNHVSIFHIAHTPVGSTISRFSACPMKGPEKTRTAHRGQHISLSCISPSQRHTGPLRHVCKTESKGGRQVCTSLDDCRIDPIAKYVRAVRPLVAARKCLFGRRVPSPPPPPTATQPSPSHECSAASIN